VPLTIRCTCGKRLRVKEELAGKRVKCPECGTTVSVPVPEEETVIEAPEEPRPEPRRPRPRKPDEETVVDERPPASAPEPEQSAPLWFSKGFRNSVLALGADAVYLASLDDEQLKQATRALKKGEPVEEVLAEPETVIPYADIKKVQSNLRLAYLDIHWQAEDAAEPTETTYFAEDADERDQILDALGERLGPDWKFTTEQLGRLRASVPPVTCLVLFGFIAFCFFMVAAGNDSGSGSRTVRTNWLGAILIAIYNFLGPTVATIIVGLIALLCVVWLVAVLVKPPILGTWSPRPARKKKRRDEDEEDED
jgi:phage FluMu protein Com